MKLEFAIIDSNTLSAMGLKQLLCDIIPVAEVSVMRSYEELLLSQPERFIHYFVASAIYFEHAQHFIKQPRRSIVLVHGDAYPHLASVRTRSRWSRTSCACRAEAMPPTPCPPSPTT